MKKKLTDEQIEKHIEESFEMNYEMLRLEGGHGITADGKKMALQQVLMYWRKLRSVAERVTDTEVKLSLPEQRSPKGRKFTIEGVVDIVKEEGDTWMYDIKTHDVEYIIANKDLYENQLNVYAYIWQTLRKQPLDHTAVISTSFPEKMRKAFLNRDDAAFEYEFIQWEPLIEIDFDQSRVDETVGEFAKVVDRIEDNEYEPPPLSVLKKRQPGDSQLFVTRVCRNCDARFSCSAYREYVVGSDSRGVAFYKKYINDLGDDADVEDWKTANLDAVIELPSFDEVE